MYFIVQRVRIIIIIANKPTAKFMIFISEYKNVCDKISRFVFLITIIFLHFYCRLFALCEFVCVCVCIPLFRGNRVAIRCEPNLGDGHRNKIWKRFSSSSHSATINIKINVGNLNKLIFIFKCFQRCVRRCGEKRKRCSNRTGRASPKSKCKQIKFVVVVHAIRRRRN